MAGAHGLGVAGDLVQQAAGAGGKTWRAYLSTQAVGATPAINARDRIGAGPWYNARGQKVGDSVAQIHGDTLDAARMGVAMGKNFSLNEKGAMVNGVGDMPNQHDMLTGSTPEQARQWLMTR